MSLADRGRSGVLDLALVVLDVLGSAGGGTGGALVVGRAPDAGRRAAALAVEPAGVAGAGALAPATLPLAMTGAPNSFVKSTVCGLSVFTSKNDCLTSASTLASRRGVRESSMN